MTTAYPVKVTGGVSFGGGEVKEKQGQRRVCKFSSDEEEDVSE